MRILKINLYVSVLVMTLLGGACKKDNEEGSDPFIFLSGEQGYITNDTIIKAGDDMSFKITAIKGTYKLTEFYIEVVTDHVERYFDTGINSPGLEWSGSFKKTFATIEQWNFIVRGRHGATSSITINISLDTSGSFGQLITYPLITLGGQNNINIPGLFSLQDSGLYTLDQANNDVDIQKKIELIYYYQSADLNVITSPGANIEPEVFNDVIKSWTYRNTTRFMPTPLTIADFNAISNDSIIIANYNEAEGKRKAKQLQAGNIYSFKTQNDKLGVFLVKNVTGTEQGSIEIGLKIQK